MPIPIVAGLLAVAAVLDLLRVDAPGPARQVDENWLGRYRDWVTGIGFGAQLGSGLSTVVSAYAIWALLLIAFLVGLPGAVLLGLFFAAGRSLPLFATRRVREPSRLAELMSRVAALEKLATPILVAGYAVALAAVVAHV
jgi:hypothetical protein